MCDQTSIEYKDGDIVWVKLGPCWWPGEVHDLDKLPQEWLAEFKKRPIAAVKFFEEDTYEYVKSIDKIYSYNCTKKNEFIKKGLDLYRAKNAFIDKFPADVTTAEKKTNGDPNIIDDPMFTPEKKTNFAALIFGSTSKPKKASKRSSGGNRRSGGIKNASPGASSKTPSRTVTHPRFVGHDDHEVRILVQTPEKPVTDTPKMDSSYNCATCSFTTTRIDVIILHNKSHIQGVYNTPTSTVKKVKKQPPKKGRRFLKMTRSKTSSILEDIALIDRGILITTDSTDEDDLDDEWDEPKPKRKRKRNKGRKKAPKKVTTTAKEDIRGNLLAEWEDDSDNEENDTLNTSSATTDTNVSLNQSENKSKDLKKGDSIKDDDSRKDTDKSCFDFEEEEEETKIVGTSAGRKIPRVIPPNDKQKSDDAVDINLPVTEDNAVQDKPIKDVEKVGEDVATPLEVKMDQSKVPDLDDEAFKDVLNATAVPDLPEIPESAKIEQNFHNSKTQKCPDKPLISEVTVKDKSDHAKPESKETSEVNAKLINPKKRFVKSFENFEQQLSNEQKKETGIEPSPEKSGLIEVSKLKTQLMTKLEIAQTSSSPKSSPKVHPKQRQLRSSKEQILSNDEDDSIISKNVNVSKTTQLPLSPKSKSSEVTRLTIKKENKASESPEKVEDKTLDNTEKKSPSAAVKSLRIMSHSDETELRVTRSRTSPLKSRRLSVKMSDVKETAPIDMELADELHDAEKGGKIQAEQAKLLEVSQDIKSKTLQVGEKVTKVQKSESQKNVTCTAESSLEIRNSHTSPNKNQSKDSTFDKKNDSLKDSCNNLPHMEGKVSERESTTEDKLSHTLNDSTTKELNKNVQQYVQSTMSSEDLSALTTLATISELTTNFDMQNSANDKSKIVDGSVEKSKVIEGLTFVTEDDLADGQVEIADSSEIAQHKAKPVTLTSFSVDFTDCNRDTSTLATVTSDLLKSSPQMSLETRTNKRKRSQDEDTEVHEKTSGKLAAIHEEKKKGSKTDSLSSMSSSKCKIEDQISLAVFTSHDEKTTKANYLGKLSQPEYTSSKLLEILTDAKPKSQGDSAMPGKSEEVVSSVNKKPDSKSQLVTTKDTVITKGVTKYESKGSKLIIKSTTPSKPSALASGVSMNKPIILSDKIIKPVSEIDNVSVQKVISKKNQDIEDIDKYIIRKTPKRIIMPPEPDIKDSSPVITKKPIVPRGKAKILQQTIIKPAGDFHTSVPSSSVPQTSIDDGMFDINSMPIVLGDQILTAENIENMPVVLSDSVQPSTFTISSTVTTTPSKTVSTPAITTTKSQSEMKLLNKPTSSINTQPLFVKAYASQKFGKNSRIYQTTGTKLIKTNPAIITRPGKPDKFIIVPPTSTATGSKYTVGKRTQAVKRSSPIILPTPNSTAKIQSPASSEPTGNKIMIVTNQQGQQSRVLLTPAQQKLLGYQTGSGSKLVKNTLKGNILQKASNTKTTLLSSPANVTTSKMTGLSSHTVINSKGEILTTSNQSMITSDGQMLVPIKSQQIKNTKLDTPKTSRKIQMHPQKMLLQEATAKTPLRTSGIPGHQKTIVIKNQQGQVVKTLQGTDDALLEKQVAEQVQAIKASGSFTSVKTKQEITAIKPKPPSKRPYPKRSPHLDIAQKSVTKPQVLNTSTSFITTATTTLQKPEATLPPLAPISPKKPETILSQTIPKVDEVKAELPLMEIGKPEQPQQKPLNQLIIQDAHGNQTTITEGQILALPSETIDGQPQSYMLVTLDESGNLAPLNNEALLSLDPNLCLGGDLSNMVLQIDEGSTSAKQDVSNVVESAETSTNNVELQDIPMNSETEKKDTQSDLVAPVPNQEEQIVAKTEDNLDANVAATASGSLPAVQQNLETVQTVTCSIGNDPNQQLIITGDPISTQKFIESLTEGNPDLANLLASAEGNILIQTDEQQILINTDADNQVLLPMNAENLGVLEASEGDGNPMFATQPTKNQDILAAALADTDVFQQDQSVSPTQNKVTQSQLSPNSGLYPGGVSNVLGTTLSLNSPIMTPLEVPSSNNKKIPDEESDILTTEVPKNVDLPITITDPNISQTVAQQQVASLIANELTGNLELPLAIPDQGVPLTSAEMNSPSYVYSLPAIDESVDIHQKTFSGPISMPLLTEEPQDVTTTDIETPIETNTESPKVEETDSVSETKEITPVTVGVDLPNSSTETLPMNSPSIDETNTLFESANLPIPESEKLETAPGTFLETSLENEEGLCTLGGAICSSLSEPPPDMFDLSEENGNFASESDNKEERDSSIPQIGVTERLIADPKCLEDSLGLVNQDVNIEYDKLEIYDGESRNDDATSANMPLNPSSPPINIDENSCEIPMQPQIVANLQSTNEAADADCSESNKRTSTDDDTTTNTKKKIKYD